MRKIPCLVLLAVLGCFGLGQAQEFGYPIEGEPWYFVKTAVSPKQGPGEGAWQVVNVRIDGERMRDFIVIQNRKEIFDRIIEGKRAFQLKIRHAWQSEAEYGISVELQHTQSERTQTCSLEVKAPPGAGYWDRDWRNYLALVAEEEHGIPRSRYPIHATVGVLSRYFRSPAEVRVIRLVRKGRDVMPVEIPTQVYGVSSWQDAELLGREELDEASGDPITRYHPTTTFSLAFNAELEPGERATYLVFYNNPKAAAPSYESRLSVRGEDLGKSIENDYYRIELDKISGMIFKILEKESGILLEHKLETNGAVHWNPGAYSPPHAWTHCSDWKEPAYTEEFGPVFYSFLRSAPLPHLKDIHVSIHYYFYQDSPLILMESSMEVKEDHFVKALRNGEVVFNKEVFDHVAFKSIKGEISMIDFTHPTRMHPEHVVTLRPDTPWVAFLNLDRGIAFASLFLEHTAAGLQGTGASRQQPYLYVQHGPWYYMSKAYVYSFGSNNQTRMLPVRKGSLYYEKTGWLPFSFRGRSGFARTIDEMFRMFKHPIYVHEVIETYPESPEGWLVPILTEPFDEGVKGAIGVKKKK
jgi:hypothetical protein